MSQSWDFHIILRKNARKQMIKWECVFVLMLQGWVGKLWSTGQIWPTTYLGEYSFLDHSHSFHLCIIWQLSRCNRQSWIVAAGTAWAAAAKIFTPWLFIEEGCPLLLYRIHQGSILVGWSKKRRFCELERGWWKRILRCVFLSCMHGICWNQ